MIAALARAERYADERAIGNASYEVLAMRWTEKADRYEAQGKALMVMIEQEIDEDVRRLIDGLGEAA